MANVYNLPAYIFPTQREQTVKASRSAVNAAGSRSTREQQLTTIAADAVVPLAYGHVRHSGLIDPVGVIGNDFVFRVFLCWGEVLGNFTLYLGNELAPQTVTQTWYTGTTTQGVDSTLVQIDPSHTDNYVYTTSAGSVGLAYGVLKIPVGLLRGDPQISVEYDGRIIYNPIIDSMQHSANPSMILLDVLSDQIVGYGRTVDYQLSTAATQANNELVDGNPRREAHVIIDTPATEAALRDRLRTLAGCFVFDDNGSVYLVPDRPTTTATAVSDLVAGSLRIEVKKRKNTPNVVNVKYTDTTSNPWATDTQSSQHSAVTTGTQQKRTSNYNLHEIHNPAQAAREAVERVNYYTLSNLFIRFDCTERLEKGNVYTVNSSPDSVIATIRVTAVADRSPGIYAIQGERYDAGIYSDSVVVTPSTNWLSLPNPNNPPAVTGLMMTEELFIAGGNLTQSRMRCEWDGSSWPFVRDYRVTITGEGDVLESNPSHNGEIPHFTVSGAVTQNVTYTATVQIVSTTGAISAPATITALAQGKLLPPGNVLSLDALATYQIVRLKWPNVIDIDLTGYEIRRGTIGQSPSSAEVIAARVDGSTYIDQDVAVGDWRYWIRALDSVGNFSPAYAQADVSVLSDPSNAQIQQIIDNATPKTLARTETIYGDGNYQYKDLGSSFADLWPNGSLSFNQSPDAPFLLLHTDAQVAQLAEATMVLVNETSGNFSYRLTEIKTLGTSSHNYSMNASADNIAYTEVSTASNVTAQAKYMRSHINDNSGTGGAIIIKAPAITKLDIAPRTESGTALVTSNPHHINYDQTFNNIPSLTINPLSTTPTTYGINNSDETGFDLYTFDASGSAVSATIDWTANGG